MNLHRWANMQGILNLKYQSFSIRNIVCTQIIFLIEKYIGVAKRLSYITIGGNGGMASIGRGEWLIAILTQFQQAALIKNGKGDILYNNSITEEIKFRVPQNGGDQYRLYECVDQVADLIDMYFGTAIEDTTNIHNLIEQEIKASKLREVEYNRLENINGGSR